MRNYIAILVQACISKYAAILFDGGVMVRLHADSRLTYSNDALPGGNMRRMKEAILYISEKCKENATYGAIKLNKILFHSDFQSFELRGIPITGEPYQRLSLGPAPLRLCIISDEMKSEGDIDIIPCAYYNKTQLRTVPKREPNMEYFSGEDIAIMNEVIKDLWDDNASEASEKSHGIAWKLCNDGDRIPYEAALLAEPSITDDLVKRALTLAEEKSW
jgi:hypothetical protein